MASKRVAEGSASGSPPAKQKKHTQFEPVQLGSVASLVKYKYNVVVVKLLICTYYLVIKTSTKVATYNILINFTIHVHEA